MIKYKDDLVTYYGGCKAYRYHITNGCTWKQFEEGDFIIGKQYKVINVWCMHNDDYFHYVLINEHNEEVGIYCGCFDNLNTNNMKEIIYQLLNEYTELKNEYIGGGEEPTSITFKGSECFKDNKKHKREYLLKIAEKIDKELKNQFKIKIK